MADIDKLVLNGTTYNFTDSALKAAINKSNIDIIPLINQQSFPYDGSGIRVTKTGESTYSFTGTITGSNFIAFYANVNTLPYLLNPGDVYLMTVDGASNNSKIYFEVLGFRNGSQQESLTGMKTSNGKYLFTIPSNWVGGVYIRSGWLSGDSGTNVNETIEFHIYQGMMNGIDTTKRANSSVWQNTDPNYVYTSCDDIPTGVILFVSSSGGVLSIPDAPQVGTLITIGHYIFPVQYSISYTDPKIIKTRLKNDTWTSWSDIGESLSYKRNYVYTSCDDINENCFLFIGSSGGVLDIPDAPYIGYLQTFYLSPIIGFQIAYPWSDTDRPKYRSLNASGWSSWLTLGSGAVTEVTQNITRDTYNNTINITTSPQITTDSNGWLQSVDTNTSDETNKTDMTGAIMSMLNSTGYCHLSPGIFYVSGNINMPEDSILEGCGKKTIIRLLNSVQSGYIVRMHTRSTIKNICFSGGYSAGSISDGNIGGRKGINYIGNRDGQDTGVTPSTCTLCQVEGCWFENLDSGFYGYNAGGGLQEGIEMSNCYFTRCKAGINIDYWTEYCKFVNCVMFQCYYGCINNGGNNVFMNCTFHGVIGFLIDNSAGDKANAAHGSVIGCTFNHIDNMNHPSTAGQGIGIKVLNTVAGFIFSNCQLWYGRIHIEDSLGIQISGCEFGGGLDSTGYNVIETSGSGTVFIDNCLFQTMPSFSFSSPSKISNCWTYSGTAVNAV